MERNEMRNTNENSLESKVNAKKSKTVKAVAICLALLIIFGALIAVLSVKFFIPAYNYNTAKKLIEEKNYTEAYNRLSEHRDYKDASEILEKFVLKYENVTVTNHKGEFVSKYGYKYDERGNVILNSEFDKDGNMLYKNEYKYDENGNRVYYAYYDGEGKQTSVFENEYNENGVMLSEKYLNESGYGKITYNERGEVLADTHCGTDGTLERHTEYKYKYDETGEKMLEKEVFENGEPEEKTVFAYNEKEKIETYFNDGNEPSGKSITTYDDRGGVVSVFYYDNDGKVTGSYEYITKYDSEDRIVSHAEYKFGDFEYKEEYTYNDDGSITTMIWYNENGNAHSKTVSDKDGRQWIYVGFDENGDVKTETRSVYDKHGNLRISGTYDKDGNMLSENTFSYEDVYAVLK